MLTRLQLTRKSINSKTGFDNKPSKFPLPKTSLTLNKGCDVSDLNKFPHSVVAEDLLTTKARLVFRSGATTRNLDELCSPDTELRPNRLWEYTWTLANSHLEKGMKILDAGSPSISFLSFYLADKGYEVCSVDLEITEPRLKRAEQIHTPLIIGQENIETLPFPNNSFDRVFCICVIEHVKNDVKGIKELVRVCKKGGLIALTTDYTKKFNPYGKAIFKNSRSYNKRQLLERIVKSSGLKLYGKTDFDNIDWNKIGDYPPTKNSRLPFIGNPPRFAKFDITEKIVSERIYEYTPVSVFLTK